MNIGRLTEPKIPRLHPLKPCLPPKDGSIPTILFLTIFLSELIIIIDQMLAIELHILCHNFLESNEVSGVPLNYTERQVGVKGSPLRVVAVDVKCHYADDCHTISSV